MERLPDFYLLDFCEWLKHEAMKNFGSKNLDMWELLFDDQYGAYLQRKSEEYCNREKASNGKIKEIFKEVLNVYYESREFEDLCYDIRKSWGVHSQKEIFDKFGKSFKDFTCREKQDFFERCSQYGEEEIPSDALVNGLKEYYKDSLENEDGSEILRRLLGEDRFLEYEFVKWLEDTDAGKKTTAKIDLMPMEVFESYVRQFCKDTNSGTAAKNRLIRNFKKSQPGSLYNKFMKVFPKDSAYRNRDFRYISQRYLSERNIYKCVLLPIESDYGKFRKLVKKHWRELNDTSADYLDIYYSFADYGESGHALKKELSHLPESLHAKLPCIALWKEEMCQAGCISISGLTTENVYEMIAGNGGIVDLIIHGKTTDEIVERVNKMGEEKRMQNQPGTKYIQKIEHAENVQQNMFVGNRNVTVDGNFYIGNAARFMKEITEAAKLVDASTLDAMQKEELKSILEEARSSVEEKSQEKAQSSKKRFKTFLVFAGNAAQKLIEILAGMATIASFFDIKI